MAFAAMTSSANVADATKSGTAVSYEQRTVARHRYERGADTWVP
jgi:hypothetical protein